MRKKYQGLMQFLKKIFTIINLLDEKKTIENLLEATKIDFATKIDLETERKRSKIKLYSLTL